MISKSLERIVNDAINKADDESKLIRIEEILREAATFATNKRFKLRQDKFKQMVTFPFIPK